MVGPKTVLTGRKFPFVTCLSTIENIGNGNSRSIRFSASGQVFCNGHTAFQGIFLQAGIGVGYNVGQPTPSFRAELAETRNQATIETVGCKPAEVETKPLASLISPGVRFLRVHYPEPAMQLQTAAMARPTTLVPKEAGFLDGAYPEGSIARLGESLRASSACLLEKYPGL